MNTKKMPSKETYIIERIELAIAAKMFPRSGLLQNMSIMWMKNSGGWKKVPKNDTQKYKAKR